MVLNGTHILVLVQHIQILVLIWFWFCKLIHYWSKICVPLELDQTKLYSRFDLSFYPPHILFTLALSILSFVMFSLEVELLFIVSLFIIFSVIGCMRFLDDNDNNDEMFIVENNDRFMEGSMSRSQTNRISNRSSDVKVTIGKLKPLDTTRNQKSYVTAQSALKEQSAINYKSSNESLSKNISNSAKKTKRPKNNANRFKLLKTIKEKSSIKSDIASQTSGIKSTGSGYYMELMKQMRVKSVSQYGAPN